MTLIFEGEPDLFDQLESEFPIVETDFQEVVGVQEAGRMTLPFNLINILSQMRSSFDDDHINELSDSIETVGLQNSPIVYFLTAQQTYDYIDLTNRVWGGTKSLEDFVEHDGGYFVLAAGECRMRAIDIMANAHGVSTDKLGVVCQVKTCDSISEILADQVAENLHLQPPPEKFAQILLWMYELGKAGGLYISESDFVSKSPVSRTRTRKALNYFKLPESVRVSVDDQRTPRFTYSHAVAMYPYLAAYKQYLADKGIKQADFEDLAEEEFRAKIQLIVSNGWSSRETDRMVRSWAHDIMHLQRSFADEFTTFIDATEEERQRILNSRKQVHADAARALGNSAAALAMFYDDRIKVDGISAQVASNIEAVRANIEVLARRFRDTEIGQAATATVAEIDELLASAPVESVQSGFDF